MATLSQLAEFLDRTLDCAAIPDYPNAVNGVQLANVGEIQRIATAVDFSTQTIDGAIAAGARLLLVHHGMFWAGVQALTGRRHQQLWALVTHDIAVYSAHLPLDVHPEFGNNVLLAQWLGLAVTGGFSRYQSISVGVSGEADVPTAMLLARARTLSEEHGGAVIVTPFDAGRRTRRWGICTGAGVDSSSLREAVHAGIDTLIVGEGPHHTAVEARDLGMVIDDAGHYATETLGVRALGDELARRFDLEQSFIPAPTGL